MNTGEKAKRSDAEVLKNNDGQFRMTYSWLWVDDRGSGENGHGDDGSGGMDMNAEVSCCQYSSGSSWSDSTPLASDEL